MSIKQDIYDLIELSKITKVPVLLVSNPGYAKTTNIRNYADENGYHLETLIGSRFNPDDIMGFMVNEPGKDVLVQKDPMWYKRIAESDKPSILFIDELSTCSESVQGSLLSLIFDRAIGNGKKLPDNCIVISAANYAENLPNFMNIISPNLNRFCIYNLLDRYNNTDIVTEFLTKPKAAIKRTISDVDENTISDNFFKLILQIILKYSDINNSVGYIDLKNSDIANIYKASGHIYNVMTGRSLSYLKDVVIGITKLRIYDSSFIKEIVGGLVGAGSNNFKSAEQITGFIDFLTSNIIGIISGNMSSQGSHEFKKDVSEEITDYLNEKENGKAFADVNYENDLVEYIDKSYGDPVKKYQDIQDGNVNKIKFISDIDSIFQLFLSTKNQKLAGIHQNNLSLYSDVLGSSETTFDEYDYGLYKPSLFKGCNIADYNGKIVKVGYIGSGDNKTYSIIGNSVYPYQATLSKVVSKDKIKILHIEEKK